jgi:Sec-independent protein secretion pathway component TatC
VLRNNGASPKRVLEELRERVGHTAVAYFIVGSSATDFGSVIFSVVSTHVETVRAWLTVQPEIAYVTNVVPLTTPPPAMEL